MAEKFVPVFRGLQIGQRRRPRIGMGIQRVEEDAHLGRHELACRQQCMHVEGLANMIRQHAIGLRRSNCFRLICLKMID